MEIDNNLTIILLIKDRTPFTFRWMQYAHKTFFPFKVLIADGGKDPIIAETLADRDSFSNVDYEYIRYPYDQTYSEYFSKIADAISRAKTNYVALADNDDFFLVDGLRNCLRFLEVHPDYVACGGRIATFSLSPDVNSVYGDNVEFILNPFKVSIEDETALKRVEKHFNTYEVTYYYVHRKDELKKYHQKLSSLDPKDLILAELVTTFLAVAWGKVKRDPGLFLLRQFNPLNSSSKEEHLKKGDRFDRMLLNNWSEDFKGFVDGVAHVVAQQDGVSTQEVKSKICKSYRKFIAPTIVNELAIDAGFNLETSFSKFRNFILKLKKPKRN